MPNKAKPVRPGEILREEFMKPLGLSRNRKALDLRVRSVRLQAGAILFSKAIFPIKLFNEDRGGQLQEFLVAAGPILPSLR
jgi:hypothetical protein